jgi:hypothetical protein
MSLFFKKSPKHPPPEPDAPAVPCDWCGNPAKPLLDGFHLLQIAFGRKQERYHFCSDNCYEAFRALYPPRIHRNCYERSCAACDDCEKTLPSEVEGIRSIAPEGADIKHKFGQHGRHGHGGGGHHH